MQYEWDDKYDTGNDKIDDQHRMIFEAANVFSAAVKGGKEGAILERSFELLLHYTNTHFSSHEVDFRCQPWSLASPETCPQSPIPYSVDIASINWHCHCN